MNEEEKIYIANIGDKIGYGGYGSVYRGIISHKPVSLHSSMKYKIKNDDREVAIKYIDFNKYNGLESIVEAFILKCTNHKYIIHAINVDILNTGKLQIILPLANIDAATAIRKNHLKPKLSVLKKWFWQLSTAVAYLHSFGIIHADIKGGNILIFSNLPLPLTGGGDYTLELDNTYVQLADFSLSVIVPNPDIGTKDTPNNFSYTSTHRSAEVWKGEYWSYPADIWALGCTFYELTYACILFPSHQGYRNEIEASIASQQDWMNRDLSIPITPEIKTKNVSKSINIKNLTNGDVLVSNSLPQLNNINKILPISCSAPTNSFLTIDWKPCNLSNNWHNKENSDINEIILLMLDINPKNRITIWELLESSYFTTEYNKNDVPLDENKNYPYITFGFNNIPSNIIKEINILCKNDNNINSLTLSLYLRYHAINPDKPISNKTCFLIAHKLLYKTRPIEIDKITNVIKDEEILLCKTLKFNLFPHI